MTVYEVKPARHGKGLFATERIPAGTAILVARGTVIPYSVVARKRKSDNALQIGRNRYIDLRAPSVFLNHSCQPNTGFADDTVLVAIKHLEQGDELFFDYSTTMDKDTVCSFTCACGSKACRKEIAGFKTLPKSLQTFYKRLGVVQKFLFKE